MKGVLYLVLVFTAVFGCDGKAAHAMVKPQPRAHRGSPRQQGPLYTPISPGVDIGDLPAIPGQTMKYDLAPHISPTATEVFIYVYVTTYNVPPYKRGYFLVWTEIAGVRYEQYLNVATGFISVTINSDNMWFPVKSGENPQLYIELVYEGASRNKQSAGSQESFPSATSSGIFIIGYK